MELIIKKSCVECPFLQDTFNSCQLKAKKEGRMDYTNESDVVPYNEIGGYLIPLWCPLKEDSVTISVEGNDDKMSSEFEYEMFFNSEPDEPMRIHGWYPISTDRIKHPEKIEHYISTGLLRKIKKIN